MRRNQVLVRSISHLTDARYFAAMGVDWMSMELNGDPASFMRWHTIRDWVEGVRLAAEIAIPDEMLVAKTVIDARPDGIIFQQLGLSEGLTDVQLFFDATVTEEADLPVGAFRITTYHPMIDMLSFLNLDPEVTFLQADWTPDMLDALLQAGYQGGICLTGGDEYATGVRDYELIDDMFRRLED